MDRRYLPAYVPKVLTAMEGAADDPTAPRFAGGKSGMSFGLMQNDVAANGDAASTLYDILNSTKATSGLSDSDIATLMRAAGTPGEREEQFRAVLPGGYEKVQKALQAGRAAVDARDNAQRDAVIGDVNRALDAAGAGDDVDPWLVTDLASWRNRTGHLKQTGDWMAANGVTTRQAYDDGYLSQQDEFTKHPGSLPKLAGRVDAATRDALVDTQPNLQPQAENLPNLTDFMRGLQSAEDGLRRAGMLDPE